MLLLAFVGALVWAATTDRVTLFWGLLLGVIFALLVISESPPGKPWWMAIPQSVAYQLAFLAIATVALVLATIIHSLLWGAFSVGVLVVLVASILILLTAAVRWLFRVTRRS